MSTRPPGPSYSRRQHSMTESTALAAFGRLVSSYTLSIYKLFAPLRTLTVEDLARIQASYYYDMVNAILPAQTVAEATPGVLKATGRLVSLYLMSLYAIFAPLPSLARDDILQIHRSYLADLLHAIARLPPLIVSSIYDFFVHPKSPEAILPWVPKSVKYVLLVFLIINSRSFPFNWHIRVWRPLFWIDLKYLMNAHRSQKEIVRRWDAISPIGVNPLDSEALWTSWASPDECSYNLRFHNSSYAKNWDSARFKDIMERYNRLLLDGGRLAVAGTHFNYIRPIPIFARYQIKSRIFAWDDKWIYSVAKFVSTPKKASQETVIKSLSNRVIRACISSSAAVKPTSTNGTEAQREEPDKEAQCAVPDSRPSAKPTETHIDNLDTSSFHFFAYYKPHLRHASESETAESSSGPGTGYAGSYTSHTGTSTITSEAANDPDEDVDSEDPLSMDSLEEVLTEPDGSVVHCVALSRCCWKMGRITIPPAIAFTSVGYGLTQEQWLRVRAIRNSGGMAAFLRGGWKDVPDAERWWEDGLKKPEVEERRKRNLEVVMSMREGFEGVLHLD